MTFANPIFLWGILGTLVPLAIHLWSKQDARVVLIGSIELLQEQESVKSRRLKLDEKVLLILRMLLILLLSLLAAGPRFELTSESEKRNLAILITPALAGAIDDYMPDETLNNARFVGIFKEGLPKWEPDKVYNQKEGDYWQLISEVERLREDSVIIISQQLLKNVKGKRPTTSKNIIWLQAGEEDVHKGIIKAREDSEGTRAWLAQSNTQQTKVTQLRITDQTPNSTIIKKGETFDSIRYQNQKNWLPIRKKESYVVGLVNHADFEGEQFYLKKALETINDHLEIDIQIKELQDGEQELSDLNLLIDLKNGEHVIDSNQKLLTYQKDEFAPLIAESVRQNHYYLTDRLNIENITDRDLIAHLIEIISPNLEAKAELEKVDARSVGLDQLNPTTAQKEIETKKALMDGSNYLWTLLLVILGVERTLSFVRKQ